MRQVFTIENTKGNGGAAALVIMDNRKIIEVKSISSYDDSEFVVFAKEVATDLCQKGSRSAHYPKWRLAA